MLLTACHKGAHGLPAVHGEEIRWQLGPYTYYGEGSDSNQYLQVNAWAVRIRSTWGEDVDRNGNFAGSDLGFFFPPDMGAGTYRLCSEEELTSVLAEAPGADKKYMFVGCLVGTLNASYFNYASSLASGGVAEVTVDAKGEYHITIDKAVTLTLKHVVVDKGENEIKRILCLGCPMRING